MATATETMLSLSNLATGNTASAHFLSITTGGAGSVYGDIAVYLEDDITATLESGLTATLEQEITATLEDDSAITIEEEETVQND